MRRLSLIAGLLLLLACNRQTGRSQCWEVQRQARDAIVKGDFERAEGLLTEARSVCGEYAKDDLRRIDELLKDRIEAKRESELAEAERARVEAFPTRRFVAWATAPVEEFSKSLVAVECAERGEPGFGFCTASRKNHPEMRVRYWLHDRSAVRYSFTTELPLECEDLGQYRPLRRWSHAANDYQLCELTQREARALSALLVRGKKRNEMFIFSFEYLQKDPEFEQLLRIH